MNKENTVSKITRVAIRMMTLWLWGGFIYFCIELAWRGWSHPAMFVVGGICFLALGGINNYLPWEMPLILQALLGGILITAIELAAGLILNIHMGLAIWDYSDAPLNILGQICLPFTIAWILLAIVGIYLDDYLRWKIYGEERPTYTWFRSS